jgi:cation diffusion facilitator family transporter
MDACCHHKADEVAALAKQGRRRVLVLVLAINVAMFVVEFGAGIVARSTALMADSVDMLGDALVYALSLYALSRSDRWKAGAALVKGVTILAFGGWIAFEIVGKLASGVVPMSSSMAVFGALALAANVLCLTLLWRYRGADLNMRSTFECSRNDVIANVGVLIAAAGVWWTGAAWPDIAVGAIVAVLFLRSAVSVIGEAWPAFRATPSPYPDAPG